MSRAGLTAGSWNSYVGVSVTSTYGRLHDFAVGPVGVPRRGSTAITAAGGQQPDEQPMQDAEPEPGQAFAGAPAPASPGRRGRRSVPGGLQREGPSVVNVSPFPFGAARHG